MATRNSYLHCRMLPEELEMIDRIKEHHGLRDRTSVVQFLAKAELNRIARTAPRSRPEKTGDSAD